MKKLFTLFTAITIFGIASAQSIWEENFDSDADGDGLLFGSFNPGGGDIYYISEISPASGKWSPVDASVAWTSGTVSPTPVFSVQGGLFEINNIAPKPGVPAGHAKWISESIDISSYSKVTCQLDFSKSAISGFNASDYFEVDVVIGGSTHDIVLEQADLNSGDLSETLTTPSLPTGGSTSMYIEIRAVNTSANTITFDNVTVEEASNNTIYEIQYTTVPGIDNTYPSPMLGQEVTVEAVVTHVRTGYGYYLQEANGDETGNGNANWKGIFVNDNANPVDVGDVVEITGTVSEDAGKTTITSITEFLEKEDETTFYDPDLIINELDEAQESVLNKIVYYKVANSAGGQGNLIAFKAGIVEDVKEGYDFEIFVDKFLFSAWGVPNEEEVLYTILTGITNFYADSYRLSPRDYGDLSFTFVPVSVENNTNEVTQVISSFNHNIILNTASSAQASIYNLSGQLVKELNIQEGRTEIEMNSGVYIVKLNDGNNLITEKVMVK